MRNVFKFLLGICLGATLHAEDVSVATLNWEPYVGKTLEGQGYFAEVVKESFACSGLTVDIRFLPWARAQLLAENGSVNAYGPAYYSEERAEQFYVSDSYVTAPLVLFARKDSSISFQTLQDLSSYRIGTVRGYVNTKEFDEASYLQKEPAVDDATNFKKLIAGRLDLVVADKYVGLYLLKKNFPESFDQIEVLTPYLDEKELYLCFPKIVPENEALKDAFNQGLQTIRDNGVLDDLFSKLNPN